jgi:glutamyl-tRNA synthetase
MALAQLDYDEGPFYQMQRMERYKQVAQMLEAGRAYRCYASPRNSTQCAKSRRPRGEKPKYDGRWRPEPRQDAAAPAPPAYSRSCASQPGGRRRRLE